MFTSSDKVKGFLLTHFPQPSLNRDKTSRKKEYGLYILKKTVNLTIDLSVQQPSAEQSAAQQLPVITSPDLYLPVMQSLMNNPTTVQKSIPSTQSSQRLIGNASNVSKSSVQQSFVEYSPVFSPAEPSPVQQSYSEQSCSEKLSDQQSNDRLQDFSHPSTGLLLPTADVHSADLQCLVQPAASQSLVNPAVQESPLGIKSPVEQLSVQPFTILNSIILESTSSKRKLENISFKRKYKSKISLEQQ